MKGLVGSETRDLISLESLAVTSIRSRHPMASDRSQKRNLEKATRISYSSAKGYCAVCPFVVVGKKENVEPSWKNQKADAPVIELGKGNRNLVMGVTGTHTPINLGGRETVGCFAQMSGARDSGAGETPQSEGPGSVARLGAEALLQASEIALL